MEENRAVQKKADLYLPTRRTPTPNPHHTPPAHRVARHDRLCHRHIGEQHELLHHRVGLTQLVAGGGRCGVGMSAFWRVLVCFGHCW